MEFYLSKLRMLAALDGRSNSKVPWQYRLGLLMRNVVADVKLGVVAPTLLRVFRP